MSDEELRIYQKAQAQAKEAEKIAITDLNIDPILIDKNKLVKTATIDNIEFLDENRNPKNIFKTGDDMVVRIWFSKNGEVERLNFGVAIYSLEDYYIFGINTLLDNLDTRKYLEKGYFDVHYRKINLGTNKYYIRAGIYEDKVEKLVDFVDQSKEYFQVQAFNLNTGIVHLDYEWV
ncbi:MAG: Wzt carbohydrate-binding domain-containing protein [Bacteroidales bacterium]